MNIRDECHCWSIDECKHLSNDTGGQYRSWLQVVVVGRTGGPKNKVLRAIVTRMRRAVQLQLDVQ